MADRYTNTLLLNADHSSASNWAGDSLTSAAYKWTASGSGTGEFYVELAAGGNPSISSPDALEVDGAIIATATLGALTASSWNYGDNDTLGYSTVYVRLVDDSDPDTQLEGYVAAKYTPVANDNVFYQFTNTVVMGGGDQSAIELDDVQVLTACTGNAGTADNYLKLDQGVANKVIFAGSGTWYLDMATSGSAEVRIDRGLKPGGGLAGVYFKNETNPIVKFIVGRATVRLVDANITTLVVGPESVVYIDSGCTVGTVECNGGEVIDRGASITTWNHNSGTGTKTGTDAFVLGLRGGTFYNDGTGTATVTQFGGVFDSARDARAKNVTLTLNVGTATIGAAVVLTDTLNKTTILTA